MAPEVALADFAHFPRMTSKDENRNVSRTSRHTQPAISPNLTRTLLPAVPIIHKGGAGSVFVQLAVAAIAELLPLCWDESHELHSND
jgi:hypothetical protein